MHRGRHQIKNRAGYTLVEMLIVLAILVALATLTLPAMRGPLDKSRLRGASREIQAAIAKARTFSIRKGVFVEFHYQLNGNRWKIESVGQQNSYESDSFTDNENSTPSGLSVESSGSGNSEFSLEGELAEDSSGAEILREGELPETIVFAQKEEDSEEELFDSNSRELEASSELSSEENSSSTEVELDASGRQIIWAKPIRFLPNGRTKDTQLTLSGPRHFFVDLNVRGLTGAIGYSAPYRVLPKEEENAEPGEEL